MKYLGICVGCILAGSYYSYLWEWLALGWDGKVVCCFWRLLFICLIYQHCRIYGTWGVVDSDIKIVSGLDDLLELECKYVSYLWGVSAMCTYDCGGGLGWIGCSIAAIVVIMCIEWQLARWWPLCGSLVVFFSFLRFSLFGEDQNDKIIWEYF